MARGRLTAGTLILDSQALSLYTAQNREVLGIVASAVERGARRVVSAATLLEVQHGGIKQGRWDFILSQLHIEPLSVQWAKEAAQLLQDTGMHGHKYALDAMVAVTSFYQKPPVVMLTSDRDDMARLCGRRVVIVDV